MPQTQTTTLDSATVADKLRSLVETDKAFLQLVFENPEHDSEARRIGGHPLMRREPGPSRQDRCWSGLPYIS